MDRSTFKGEENIRKSFKDKMEITEDGNTYGQHGDIYANEYPVHFPFGPPIYLDKCPDNIISELDALIEQLGGKIEYDASGLLAGRIKKQTSLTENVTSTIQENIIYHCNRYFNHVRQAPSSEMPGYEQLTMQITAIWSNIQEAREYNPPHAHSGDFSFVIYTRNDLENMSLDEIQNNEYDQAHHNNQNATGMLQNQPLAGLIELQYGEPAWFNWTQFRHVPSRGDIIIFPSWMRHTVYAHYEENKVRISVAGNVNILNVNSNDNRQKHT
tara:strand:- start:62 stop:871 length:810 start_codon:yes stop_codon:yes gene_type:complete